MRPLLIAIFISGLWAGCVTQSREAKNDLAGYYTMVKGGFNESMSVELSTDSSYVLNHELSLCEIGPNGELTLNYSKEEGIWRFEGGVIFLEPKGQTKDFPNASVFAPFLAHRLLPKQDGFNQLLVNADYPDRFAMKKTKKPIQSFTSSSGAK